MRLTLELIDGPHAGEARAIDGGTAFSVGTEHGATWVLAGARGVARLDLRRGPNGFEASVQGEVTIEGQPAPDGMAIHLSHGSRIGLGDRTLRASVTQEAATGLGGSYANPEPLTISTILSDISAGGDTATGLLPGRGGNDFLQHITGSRSSRPDPLDRIAAFGYGPNRPAPSGSKNDKPLATYLPEDWDKPSDRLNRVFQAEASSAALRIGLQEDGDEDDKPRKAKPAVTSHPLLGAAGLRPEEVDGPPERQLANAGRALTVSLAGIGRLERAMAHLRSDLGLPHQGGSASDPAALAPAAILSDEGGLYLRNLITRIEALETAQQALVDGIRAFVATARTSLDPETISAGASRTGGLRQRFLPDSAAWAAYRACWSSENADEFPLSDKALARAITTPDLDRTIKEVNS